MKKLFKAVLTTDHHTIHPNTPTRHILNNLDTFYYKETNLATIDFNVLNGDFFHDLAPANDPNMMLCHRWIKKHLQICHDNKVHVRILEGTSSHDWGQPECFDILKPKDSPYIKYINTLSIEFIPELNIHCMYVPDNFGHTSTDIIYDNALKLLAEWNLKEVDFIFLHGGFDYQLPPIANKKGTLYDSIKWSALAKHAIFSGHIHKPSTRYNIYCAGSFDRTAFGEMHPKGAYRFEFNDTDFKAEFWENKNALIYDKILINKEMDTKAVAKEIMNYLAKLPPKNTHIRLVGGLSSVTTPLINDFKEQYPQYSFDLENVKEDNIEIDDTLYIPEMYNGVALTNGNLKDSLFNFMESTLQQNTDIDRSLLEELLDEVMNVN
ncbi:nuclease [Erwinia phage AH04]|uniref:Nuclease n=1 Tax=Erwinia phage AH04 TaxID=2869569 RepID=A0AAE7X1F8_9CAUD|nr:SbcD-like subunit of palindrome specific endonuclease [Erwinia phage AH04]QZA70554.1 nuclease [Erwinia phage AH04]